MGKKVYLITNNNQTSREEMAKKCMKMNFDLGEDSMMSSAYATAQYVKNLGFDMTAYLIGAKALDDEFEKAGIARIGYGPDVMEAHLREQVPKTLHQMKRDVGAVVVGFDEHFSFPKLFKAVNYLRDPNVLFIATNADQKVDFPSFTFPDAGPIIAAIENVTGRKATVVGKPSKILAELALSQESHRDSNRFLMIGDRLNTDILFGKNNNFQTLLVGTGVHSMSNVDDVIDAMNQGKGDEHAINMIPDFYISALRDLFNKA